MKTKIIQNIKSIILALILVAGVGIVSAYSTWTAPEALPPGKNADTPINVGSIAQAKSGPLTIGDSAPPTAGYALDVKGTSGLASFRGILTEAFTMPTGAGAGKVLMSDENGIAYWDDLEQETTDYRCSLVADTLGANNRPSEITRFMRVSVPSGCRSEEGCSIKQELYGKRSTGAVYLHSIKRYTYLQNVISGSANDTWWSSYQTSGKYKNGDINATNVVAPRNDSRITVKDDRNTVSYSGFLSYTEVSETEWSAYDSSASYGQKLYICELTTEDVI